MAIITEEDTSSVLQIYPSNFPDWRASRFRIQYDTTKNAVALGMVVSNDPGFQFSQFVGILKFPLKLELEDDMQRSVVVSQDFTLTVNDQTLSPFTLLNGFYLFASLNINGMGGEWTGGNSLYLTRTLPSSRYHVDVSSSIPSSFSTIKKARLLI